MINLSTWLNTNDIYNLKNFGHAYKLRKTAQDRSENDAARAVAEYIKSQDEACSALGDQLCDDGPKVG